jgi:hypothetical protein
LQHLASSVKTHMERHRLVIRTGVTGKQID